MPPRAWASADGRPWMVTGRHVALEPRARVRSGGERWRFGGVAPRAVALLLFRVGGGNLPATGERRLVRFTLTADHLAFYGRAMRRMTEPGQFHVWIGGSSTTDLRTEFVLSA